MKTYSSIISKRIATGRFEPSVFESGVYVSIDYFEAKDNFELLIVTENEFYLCNCYEKDGRVRINSMQSATHDLREMLTDNPDTKSIENCFQIVDGKPMIDCIFESMIAPQLGRIASALSGIKATGNGKLRIYGSMLGSVMFRYALQKYFGGRELVIADTDEPVKADGRVLFPDEIFKVPLNLNIPDALIVKYISKPWCPMVLPLAEGTLSAKVWNSSDLAWGDIIPDLNADFSLADVPCKSITLSFSIDIFGNIISRVYGSDGHKCVRLFKNAMGADIKEVMTISKQEKSAPVKKYPTFKHKEKSPAEVKHTESKAEAKPVDEPYSNYKFDDNLVAKSTEIDGLTSGTAIIKYGSTWTYEALFSDYLAGAVEIYLKDPYIAKFYQLNNLKMFISTAIQASRSRGVPGLKRFHLVTFPADVVVADENKKKNADKRMNPEEALKKQEKFLSNLANDLKKVDVHLTYAFNDNKNVVHDRHVELSNGWNISIGRGLDIFEKPENDFVKQTCRETEITYNRKEEIVVIKEKNRKIEIL